MHRGRHVVRSDVKISETIAGLVDDIAKSLRVDLEDPDKEVSCAWQDISVLSDPGEPPLRLEFNKQLSKSRALAHWDLQSLGQISLCQRLILRRSQQFE